MKKIENVSTLKIHKLTQEQYDRELAAGRLEDNAIYMTPGDEILPIEKGGTGATNVGAARENLGVYSTREANIKFISKATNVSDADIDTTTSPGFYYAVNAQNSPFSRLYMEVGEVFFSGDNYYFQKAIDVENGTKAIRYTKTSPRGFRRVEWEYENPPMEVGVVYKTTERFGGKPVYTTRILITDFENGKEVDVSTLIGGEKGHVLRYAGYLYGNNYTKTLPYIYFTDNDSLNSYPSAWLTFSNNASEPSINGHILMKMHGGNGAFDVNGTIVCDKGEVQIWFIKKDIIH